MKRHCAICQDVFNGFGSLCPKCWSEAWARICGTPRAPVQIIT